MKAIIAALIAAFGPLIGELIKKWLDKALNTAAGKLAPADSFSSPAKAVVSLLTLAIESQPKLAFGKRTLLRAIQRNAAHVVSGFPLSATTEEEIRDAGASAARDK